jgi:hypothetical protein
MVQLSLVFVVRVPVLGKKNLTSCMLSKSVSICCAELCHRLPHRDAGSMHIF